MDLVEANMAIVFSLIKFYFDLGLSHWEMFLSLSHADGISITVVCRLYADT